MGIEGRGAVGALQRTCTSCTDHEFAKHNAAGLPSIGCSHRDPLPHHRLSIL
uniref:Uncharacterized protein n=1 Tax=Arundo donax TaxID=35708 RepID=A0A0A8Z8B3_ARUDO